ncbi:MAG: hypothetical protein ABI880_09525 [Acidobacteriota bacterium]
MKFTFRSSIALALLALAWFIGPASAHAAAATVGLAGTVGGFTARLFSTLPESGSVLLWGSALAAASLAMARKGDRAEK